MKYEVEGKVKEIFNTAMGEAKAYDDAKVTPTHILISIIINNDNKIIPASNMRIPVKKKGLE